MFFLYCHQVSFAQNKVINIKNTTEMNLTKTLRKQGYDLIEGPIRNHNLLQLWLKTMFNGVKLYYAHLQHAFKSSVVLYEIENKAFRIDASVKDEYGFNIGISLLEDILDSLGLGAFKLLLEIVSGKKISISYDHSITKEIPIGEIQNYLLNSDFLHPNRALLNNANKDNILIISGVLFAKNLVVEIKTDFSIDADFVSELTNLVDDKLNLSILSKNSLKMVSKGENFFPVAVKASRINFYKGHLDRKSVV